MMDSITDGANKPVASEWRLVLLLIAAFFGFNLATFNYYPGVWCDEVWFSEPAINLVKDGIFHSTTWLCQPPHTFPTVNCPLYMMALVPWLSVVGTSVLAVRAFNYALMGTASFLIWALSWRFNLVRPAWVR